MGKRDLQEGEGRSDFDEEGFALRDGAGRAETPAAVISLYEVSDFGFSLRVWGIQALTPRYVRAQNYREVYRLR